MPTILVTGPEKAGKTTLCQEIVRQAGEGGLEVEYRHMTGKDPFTGEHSWDILARDRPGLLMVYDRGWPDAVIYGGMGYQQQPEALHEEAEQTIGEYIRDNGLTVILLGPSAEEMRAKRTADDWPIDVQVEKDAYSNYARRHGWTLVDDHEHTEEACSGLALKLIQLVTGNN